MTTPTIFAKSLLFFKQQFGASAFVRTCVVGFCELIET